MASLIIGFLTDDLPKGLAIEPLVALAFCIFLFGIYIIIIDNELPRP
jgi:hypothetical protein